MKKVLILSSLIFHTLSYGSFEAAKEKFKDSENAKIESIVDGKRLTCNIFKPSQSHSLGEIELTFNVENIDGNVIIEEEDFRNQYYQIGKSITRASNFSQYKIADNGMVYQNHMEEIRLMKQDRSNLIIEVSKRGMAINEELTSSIGAMLESYIVCPKD